MLKIKNLQENILLSQYSTYKIGGPADYFFIAKNKNDLIESLIEARKNEIPYFIIGKGANILFGDRGFRGLIIKNEVDQISLDDRGVLVSGSGAVISDLINFTKDRGLSGLEHFAGIPSTVGGAIWQNLHFLSPDRKETIFISSILKSAKVIDDNNQEREVDNKFFSFGYDYSILHEKNFVVTEASFGLEKKDKKIIQNQIDENLKWRSEKQPNLEKFPSCGSVFKKIEGVGAGRLVDSVGLKGYRVGGAMISEKHANFIVNLGGAKASDVLNIIETVKSKVKKETGYLLEAEIGFVGEF